MKCGSDGGNPGLRFNRKSANENERRMFASWWQELTQLYGTYTDYYVYEYSLTAQDSFYGEHPLAPFRTPVPMTIMAQFNNDSLLLSKFGIRTDADVTFIIPILDFRIAFNDNLAEPKAGDLIRLTELGWDRPGGIDDINTITGETTSCSGKETQDPLKGLCEDGIIPDLGIIDCNTDSDYYSAYDDPVTFDQLRRGAPIYEITERRDENMTMNYNMLQGHYVWIIHAKRFDYSYQPNAPREPGHDQVSDETQYGKLSGGTDFPENDKQYPGNVEDDSNKNWDYDRRDGSDDSVYGNY
jgi:hypothetical protein